MRILALGAHPDDVEYGCGGMLLQAVDSGHDVFLHVLTDGSITSDADRQAEQATAAAFLGARDVFWEGMKDTTLTPCRDLIEAIEGVISKIVPDMVMVNYIEDSHQDHQALANSARAACRYVRKVLYYHDFTTLNFSADTFLDIEPVLARKKELLACHASQVQKPYETGFDLLESVSALAAYYGFLAKVKYAEGYLPLRNLISL